MKNASTVLCFLFFSLSAWATHNRAGEILYKSVQGNTPFLFEITVITYTKTGGASNQADRCELTVDFGDGTSAKLYRKNGPVNGNCGPNIGDGEMVAFEIKKNIYTTRHQFPGPGSYMVSMEDPMRNENVKNIPNSGNVPFYLESKITIDVNSGGNSAPSLSNPPVDNGCIQKKFEHNPGAIDPDGDSLYYSIVASKSYGGSGIGGYLFPDQIVSGLSNQLNINPNTGTLVWDAPQEIGEYNVAILIEEFRKNLNSGQVFKVGEVLRDIQIDVQYCESNLPPVIGELTKTCVTSGQIYIDTILAADPNQSDAIILSGTGLPMEEGYNGTLRDISNAFDSARNTAALEFTWPTKCDFVRLPSYWLYFKAKEDKAMNAGLVDFEELEINVVSPSVDIVSVLPEGNALTISWTKADCSQASGYKIYRFNDSLGYVAPNCVTGMPDGLGYALIGENIGIENVTFVDNNAGSGLTHGQKYCYVIVTTFADGALSYPSPEWCGELIRDVPILNKVSVGITSASAGTDTISWIRPTELKSNIYGPPYQYKLSRLNNNSGNFDEVYRSGVVQDFNNLDTFFIDENLNTLEEIQRYKIELLSGLENKSVGNSSPASSVHLYTEAFDNRIQLSWSADVPWQNEKYLIYRYADLEAPFDSLLLIDSTSSTIYVDSNLANNKTYRYRILALGKYSSNHLSGGVKNWSQECIGVPIDVEPPCAPTKVNITGDCDLSSTKISWVNPNDFCKNVDDVVSYNIYYTPVLGETPYLIASITDPAIVNYERTFQESIAGCYAITAIDSFDNESQFSEAICLDNCPEYILPNVFTPGRDGKNDYFKPFPYKFIKDIDLVIYNRWGVEVFRTTNPDILWEGFDIKSGKPLADGVYFYVCTVNEIRLTGIVSREIKSFVQIIRQEKVSQNPE